MRLEKGDTGEVLCPCPPQLFVGAPGVGPGLGERGYRGQTEPIAPELTIVDNGT